MGCEVSTSNRTAQGRKVLRYMEKNGSITAGQALKEFGCSRLAARINDLRALGAIITSTPVIVRNRDKVKVRIAEYSLGD